MIFLEKLAIRLSLTKAEIYVVTILLGFLVLGVVVKNFQSVEETDILIKKAEKACPEYFRKDIYDHMKEDKEYDFLIKNLSYNIILLMTEINFATKEK